MLKTTRIADLDAQGAIRGSATLEDGQWVIRCETYARTLPRHATVGLAGEALSLMVAAVTAHEAVCARAAASLASRLATIQDTVGQGALDLGGLESLGLTPEDALGTPDPDMEPETVDALVELCEAIRLTVEYVGLMVLPPIPGWSWFDALAKFAPAQAHAFRLQAAREGMTLDPL